MSRNPMAGSLKHFRQHVVPDKREQLEAEAEWTAWWGEWSLMPERMRNR